METPGKGSAVICVCCCRCAELLEGQNVVKMEGEQVNAQPHSCNSPWRWLRRVSYLTAFCRGAAVAVAAFHHLSPAFVSWWAYSCNSLCGQLRRTGSPPLLAIGGALTCCVVGLVQFHLAHADFHTSLLDGGKSHSFYDDPQINRFAFH